jgi:hypothetical protein
MVKSCRRQCFRVLGGEVLALEGNGGAGICCQAMWAMGARRVASNSGAGFETSAGARADGVSTCWASTASEPAGAGSEGPVARW